ncbi:hypothetical protein ACOMHN_046640 [Nucella lapillus]
MSYNPGGSGYPGYPPAYPGSTPQGYPPQQAPPAGACHYPYPASANPTYYPPPPQPGYPQYPASYPPPLGPSTTYVSSTWVFSRVVIRPGFPGFTEKIVIKEGFGHHHHPHPPHHGKTVIRDGRDKIIIKERGDHVIVKEKHKHGGWW